MSDDEALTQSTDSLSKRYFYDHYFIFNLHLRSTMDSLDTPPSPGTSNHGSNRSTKTDESITEWVEVVSSGALEKYDSLPSQALLVLCLIQFSYSIAHDPGHG